MESQISNMVESYEHGLMNRRQLIVRLGALFATASVASSQEIQTAAGTSTFKGVGLNHIALRVTDVERSRDFYVKHLGLEVSRQSLPGNCFMNVGDNFVALFRGAEAGMDHYCYSIENYDQQAAAAKLRAEGIEPRLEAGRIYFPDPDGLTVQLAPGSLRP